MLAPVFQSCSSAPLRAGMFTYTPRGKPGGSESGLAGRVNPVPPICELDGPRTSEVRKETRGGETKKKKEDDMKKENERESNNQGVGQPQA